MQFLGLGFQFLKAPLSVKEDCILGNVSDIEFGLELLRSSRYTLGEALDTHDAPPKEKASIQVIWMRKVRCADEMRSCVKERQELCEIWSRGLKTGTEDYQLLQKSYGR